MTIFTDLISNVALLLALSILYSFLTRIWKQGEIPGQILAGILFGGVAVAGMLQPFNYAPGVIFDGRSMVVSMAGLFGGPVTAAISTLIAGGYRLGLGGTGALTGFGVIFTSAALGVGYHYLRRKNPDVTKPSYLFAFGVIVHISMLLWMLTLPWPLAFEVLDKISLPVMLIFPLATLFLAKLLADQEERNYTEDALRKSEEQYRLHFENASDVIYSIDSDFRILNITPSVLRVLGYKPEELIGRPFQDLNILATNSLKLAFNNTMQVLSGERISSAIYEFVAKDGTRKFGDVSGAPLLRNGKVTGVVSIARDITERKLAEAALRESEERFHNMFAKHHAVMLIIEPDMGDILDANLAAERFYGYPIDRLRSMNIADINSLSPDQVAEERKRAASEKRNYFVFPHELASGEERIVEVHSSPISLQERQVLFSIVHDITERKQAEEALRESEKQLSIRNRIAEIFLTIPDDEMYGKVLQIVLECMESPYGTFAYINEDGDRIVPSMTRDIWDECKMSDKDIFFPRDTWGDTLWARCLIEKKSFSSNGPFKIPDGHMPIRRALATPIIHKGESIGNLMVGDKSTDYSEKDKELLEAIADRIAPILHSRLLNERHERERNRAEEEKAELESKLQRAQKMEAMGLMAGGVAHDLNNILSGIVSYPELLLMDLPEDSPLRKPIKTIQESGMRAADVVEDLLTIARGVASGKEVLNLNTVVKGYLDSAEHHKLEKIHPLSAFKTELDSELLNVTGSASHANKILMNLVTNASEAIEGSGTVTISTANRYLDEPLKGYEDVHTGEYVVLAISDDGTGISPKDLDKIFEPFYTKKVMGRSGTGLGLAVVWNTVQDHNGYINVESSEKGTVFDLYFPVTRKDVSDEKEKTPLENYLGHGEKILVVDDEERQRVIACGILTKLGYMAEAVSSGEEAIEYVKEHAVDLIVLDMVMPKGINGHETYQQIIKIRPGQKAVIASGYAKTKEVDIAQELGAGKYIKKPYTLSKVGLAVKKELEK